MGGRAMTYQVTPGTTKARQALAFGLELHKACTARDVSFNELERKIGVGHTTIWHYRFGHMLPRLARATELAEALDWAKLRELVLKARTRTCARKGCGRTFVNDVGSEARKYCAPPCRRIAGNLKQAEARARSAGQTGSFQARRAHVQRLRSAVRIADERVQLLTIVIAAMCGDCEPDGLCRTADCPLRLFSPLPLSDRAQLPVRTLSAIRDEIAHRPSTLAKRSAAMKARHADPVYAARHSASIVAAFAKQTPERKAAGVAKRKASYPAERRSAVSKAMHAARRQEAAS